MDVAARELAGEFPELGIGRGYTFDESYDDTDHASLLWDLLRERPPTRASLEDDLTEAAGWLDEGLSMSEHVPLKLSSERFADWLIRNDVPWPRLESGQMDLKSETFRAQAKCYPQVGALRELLAALASLKLFHDLAVGADGRNRCMLSPVRARTGRNQPSSSRFIFGPHVFLRCLIQPQPGRALAYIDWSQQEIAIGAALSRDGRMMEAYSSGDFYLSFAKQCGAAPPEATKQSHSEIRDLYKRTCLGVQYRMGEKSLAEFLGQPLALAKNLLREHRETYPKFWTWSEHAVDHAILVGHVETVFGWPVRPDGDEFGYVNARSIANHPCQGNGAEMMRLAACLMVEAGIEVNCPVHDAFLVESDADVIEQTTRRAQELMEEASRIVLDGFKTRTEATIIRHPDRYMDEARGRKMWDTVMGVLGQIRAAEPDEIPS